MTTASQLTVLDYSVIAIYLVVLIIVCVRVTRKSPTADELFLAGRTLGPAVIGLSLFASNISSTTLIGLPGAAWEHGISVANYEWMAALVLVFTAIWVAPVFIGRRLTTVPEILERRFDGRMRRYLSGTSLFLSVVLDTAGSLYAGALVLMLFIPGLELGPTCAAMALFAGLYTTAGGLRAVAYTDVLQTVVLLSGSLMLAVMVFARFDFSWSAMTADLPAGHLSLIRPLDDPALPWLGTLIGLPILGFYYWTMNQYVAQRLLGARDTDAAVKGALIAALLKLLPLFLMVLPGAVAATLFTDLERADTIFPRMIAEFAPAGFAGLLIAGLMAAIMSSVDSTLNSASTLFVVDFAKHRHPDMDHRTMARWGRYCTLVLMIAAALWAPMIDHFPGLFAYLQQAFAYVTPPLVAAFALGFTSRRIGAEAAFFGTLAGHGVSAMLFVGWMLDWHQIHFTIVAGGVFFITLVLIGLFQLVGGQERWAAPTTTQLDACAQRHADPVAPALRGGAAIATALTVLLVLMFW